MTLKKRKSGHAPHTRKALLFLTILAVAVALESSAHAETDTSRPGLYFSPHKLNYVILNNLPPNDIAQIKYQISAKYQVIDWSDYHLYFAYTQKSFWNIGKPSMPFEETNYNPEIFIHRPIDRSFRLEWLNREIVLKDVSVGLFEHESNGLAGPASRSWNRSYLGASLGVESKKELEETDALIQFKILMSIKLWTAYGESNQRDYLNSIGRGDERFSDYAGRGEVGVGIRDILLRNNQIDFKTRIFRAWNRGSYEAGYHHKLLTTNFFLYAQYWRGYGESLLRFTEYDRRFKMGLSFFY